MQSHTQVRCGLRHGAEAAGDLVGTEVAPSGCSPALGQLLVPLKVPIPMGILGNHNLCDRRKQITGLSAVKKTRGEEGKVLFPAPFSPVFMRALTAVPETLSLPRYTHAVDKG